MENIIASSSASPLEWKNNLLLLLDQRKLPDEVLYLTLNNALEVSRAIRDMVVRGAPAIGVTAAYGVALAAIEHEPKQAIDALISDMHLIAQARPTAINLNWAVERMKKHLCSDRIVAKNFIEEAKQIHQQAINDDAKMATLGASLLDGGGVLTHCNAGALATCGVGTALGVIRAGIQADKISRVFADETRPWLQGARLTAWELIQDGIDTTLICEGAAASLMQQGKINWVIVGADRVAANGDVANKIGTYALAILAKYHGVRFMVVAPWSTIDLSVPEGGAIPIEQRDKEEIFSIKGKRIAAQKANGWNPVFDITPANLITALVTETGVILQPNREKILAAKAEEY